MNKLFIHKYQPLYFKDFHIDDKILKIINTLIMMDNLNILLIGDLASGKTTILNAIIREYYVNINPKFYEENVLYINNLKEQGIHYYRTEVKTFCQTCSNIHNKKKIIILDDIDLINEQSQQVFRNCIDKYSHNVHFISSCTNIQKIIENLQSRFTIIKINKFNKTQLLNIINNIKEKENIIMENGVDEYMINISNHSIKAIINYMEKMKLLKENITMQLATQLCFNISFFTFEEYIKYILNKQLKEAIKIIYEICDNGYSVMDILDNFFAFLKITDLLNEEQKYKVIPYICKYITIFHTIHEDDIELTLFTNNLVQILN